MHASIALLAAAAFAGAGCGSSTPATSTAAAVAGPLDDHCTVNDVEIKQPIGMCVADDGSSTSAALSLDDGGADAATDALIDASSDDASSDASSSDASSSDASDDDGGVTSDYGPTLYNAEGDDDDCKYHVRWTSTAVKENAGVVFDVNAIRRADGQPATGANVQLEVFLNPHHPTPTNDIPNTESAGGNYKVGPVVFDAPGTWTVRFHFYETCSDEPEDSPHGHAAFFVQVP